MNLEADINVLLCLLQRRAKITSLIKKCLFQFLVLDHRHIAL